MKHDRARVFGKNLAFPKFGKNGEILLKNVFFDYFVLKIMQHIVFHNSVKTPCLCKNPVLKLWAEIIKANQILDFSNLNIWRNTWPILIIFKW